jgi:hypothetical protein
MWARWLSVDKRPFPDNPRTASLLEHRPASTREISGRSRARQTVTQNAKDDRAAGAAGGLVAVGGGWS